jgi:hypothetical protein
MSVREACERLNKIQWRHEDSRLRSNTTLVREYLRRMALWSKALDTDDWPFMDVALLLAPAVRAPARAVEDARALVGELTSLSRYPIANVCEWYLHWIALESEQPDVVRRCGLPAPYEPLILMFERGGLFYVMEGYVNVGHVGIQIVDRSHYQSPIPVVELNCEALDSLD